MKNSLYIRELRESDLPVVTLIVDDNQLFPPEYLGQMAEGFLTQQTEELWFVAESDSDGVVAVAYCSPERMTEGTWNLLLIAVFKSHQGSGIGAELMRTLESALQEKRDVRVLLVETSGTPEYELTREFYPKCGYKQVALIPEYYDEGDDKVVFWKSLVS